MEKYSAYFKIFPVPDQYTLFSYTLTVNIISITLKPLVTLILLFKFLYNLTSLIINPLLSFQYFHIEYTVDPIVIINVFSFTYFRQPYFIKFNLFHYQPKIPPSILLKNAKFWKTISTKIQALIISTHLISKKRITINDP